MARTFEWDARKAETNIRKHGVSFETAVDVFSDPFAFAEHRIENGEHRWLTLGMTRGWLLLAVAHIDRDENDNEVVRLISARRADRSERKRYEQQSDG